MISKAKISYFYDSELLSEEKYLLSFNPNSRVYASSNFCKSKPSISLPLFLPLSISLHSSLPLFFSFFPFFIFMIPIKFKNVLQGVSNVDLSSFCCEEKHSQTDILWLVFVRSIHIGQKPWLIYPSVS